jgi:hypothetical protein
MEDPPTAVPIAVEWAPDEKEVTARVTDRLHAELAERLEREVAERMSKERELQIVAQAVQVPTKEAGGNDDDDDEDSSICGLSRNCFVLVVAVSLLIIVGVVVGVVVALGGKGGDPPTMAPTATVGKTPAPTASPTIYTSPKFTQLLNLLGAVTPDIKLLQDPTTFQYSALDWLANVDAWEVDIDSVPPQVFVERYVLALLFLSTNGKTWSQGYNFLTPTSVCDWSGKSDDDSIKGVICDGTDVWQLRMCTCRNNNNT